MQFIGMTLDETGNATVQKRELLLHAKYLKHGVAPRQPLSWMTFEKMALMEVRQAMNSIVGSALLFFGGVIFY